SLGGEFRCGECRRRFRRRSGRWLRSICVQPAHRAAHRLGLPAGRYCAYVLVAALAEPPLFSEDREAAEGGSPRACDVTQEFSSARLLPFVVGLVCVRTRTSTAARSTVPALPAGPTVRRASSG